MGRPDERAAHLSSPLAFPHPDRWPTRKAPYGIPARRGEGVTDHACLFSIGNQGRLIPAIPPVNGYHPVDRIVPALAKARRSAPDDDLVWLASANLAIRTGRFDEAAAWLDR